MSDSESSEIREAAGGVRDGLPEALKVMMWRMVESVLGAAWMFATKVGASLEENAEANEEGE